MRETRLPIEPDMIEHETFPRAPITEALIDLRVVMSSDGGLEKTDELARVLKDRFPNREQRIETMHQIKVGEEAGLGETHTRSRRLGSIIFAEDRRKALQARINGFAFSKLQPYEDWGSLRDEARELWGLYCEMMQPKSVTRLAVRYINRIELPLPMENFQEYILTGPEIAEGAPQAITEFFFRVVVPSPDGQMTAAIISTMEKPEKDGAVLPYIFDIDAFMEVDLEPASDEIWPYFEKLRDYKNQIFFSSTTDKCKKLFR